MKICGYRCGRPVDKAAGAWRGVVNAPADALALASVSTKYPELAELLKQKSLRWGKFTLVSGKRSNYYIDGKLTSLDAAGAAATAAVAAEVEDAEPPGLVAVTTTLIVCPASPPASV